MPRPHTIAQRHLLLDVMLMAWLITWITAVPLFHVHVPDNTDRWSSVQSGGPHTVLTRDLPGEFSHPYHDHFGHLSPRAVNSPELSFILLSDTDQDQKGKQLWFLSSYGQGASALLSSCPFESSGTYRGPPPFHAFPAFRAPPHFVCA